jgi:hypothetical protein
MFLGLGFPGGVPWYAFYRVDTIGVAFSVGSLFVLAGGTSHRRLIAAGVLAALALLTKQTLFAAGLAGTVWLMTTSWRKAGLFAGSAIVPVVLSCLLAELTTHSFITDTALANINPFTAEGLGLLGTELLQTQLPALLLGAFYVIVARPWQACGAPKLLMFYWLASFVPVAGIAKVGADTNYWIEFAAATAVLAALGVSLTLKMAGPRWRASAAVLMNLCVLYVGLIVVGPVASTQATSPQIEFREDPDYQALIDRVRAEPRGVLASPSDVVVLAGRPIQLEPLIYSLFLQAGRWDVTPMIRRICGGDIGLVVVARALDQPNLRPFGYPFWPEPVYDAMSQAMVLEERRAGRFVYVPKERVAPRCAPTM